MGVNKGGIVKYIKGANLVDSKAKFSCYHDNMFVYDVEAAQHEREHFKYILTIICEDSLLDVMTVKELMQSNGLCYAELKQYSNEELEEDQTLILTVTYNINSNLN